MPQGPSEWPLFAFEGPSERWLTAPGIPTAFLQAIPETDEPDPAYPYLLKKRHSLASRLTPDPALLTIQWMPDYRQDQDWFMRELEEKQRFLQSKEIEDAIAGIDAKLRGRIVKRMRFSKRFAGVTAKECFERWKAGYRRQQASAVRLLKELQEDDTDYSGL